MTHGSLFSGIGGFDLAAEWMGWENKFHCEWDKFCQQVLKKHFPKAITYEDITNTDFTIWNGLIDVVSGGFPCQPYSAAGLRKGNQDDRHLWPEMLRAVREIQPRWIVGENVLGLINWSKGLVFEQIQTDLETAGYKVWTFVLPACGVNALHRRERLWFTAYSDSNGFHKNQVQQKKHFENNFWNDGRQFELLVAKGKGYFPNTRSNRVHNGIPNGLDECRLKALGNGVVPQVVYQIFKTIQQYETP